MTLTSSDLTAIKGVFKEELKPVLIRLDKIEIRLDNVETRLDKVERTLSHIQKHVRTENEADLEEFEKKLNEKHKRQYP
ncbi:MAG: hypothetical protein WDO14_11930 [Bacteroidota bacterium]